MQYTGHTQASLQAQVELKCTIYLDHSDLFLCKTFDQVGGRDPGAVL